MLSFLEYKVAQLTKRTYVVNQVFRFVEDIERVIKSDFFFGKDLFYFIRAQHVLSYHLMCHVPCVNVVHSFISTIEDQMEHVYLFILY